MLRTFIKRACPSLPRTLGAVPACACERPVWTRCLALLCLLATHASAQPAPPAPPINPSVRVGFLLRELGNSNRTDVVAAMKVWMLTVAKNENLSVETSFEVFDTVNDMMSALHQEQLDVFSASMAEFQTIEKTIPCNGVFASLVHGKVTEEMYCLCTRTRQ